MLTDTDLSLRVPGTRTGPNPLDLSVPKDFFQFSPARPLQAQLVAACLTLSALSGANLTEKQTPQTSTSLLVKEHGEEEGRRVHPAQVQAGDRD